MFWLVASIHVSSLEVLSLLLRNLPSSAGVDHARRRNTPSVPVQRALRRVHDGRRWYAGAVVESGSHNATLGQGTPFAARLRRLREAAGLTQEELASMAGLSACAIASLERGERKRPYLLQVNVP